MHTHIQTPTGTCCTHASMRTQANTHRRTDTDTDTDTGTDTDTDTDTDTHTYARTDKGLGVAGTVQRSNEASAMNYDCSSAMNSNCTKRSKR